MDATHNPLILIPSYNSGRNLRSTIADTLSACSYPVWIVVDGSTDGSDSTFDDLAAHHPARLKVLRKEVNQGKGAAVRTGCQCAIKEGYTHVLVMDSDGQHPADHIERFVSASRDNPKAMILGQPVFDESVPIERLHGRKLSVWLVQLETLGTEVGDPLYGFRIYPIAPLLSVMGHGNRSNRYDFDPEVAVRLVWKRTPTVKLSAPVLYLSKEQGGVSHFHYLRDNFRFVLLHTKLIIELILRLPLFLIRKLNAR